jgi:uroporphyrinogen-III decarboxylase
MAAIQNTGLPENWREMTPAEKRKYRQEKFLGAERVNFVSETAKQNYRTRAQRMIDVYNVTEPDRVPTSVMAGSMPQAMAGIDGATAMRDFEKSLAACDDFNSKYAEDLESWAGPGAFPSRVMELLDYKLYAWPGHGIPAEATGMQYVEGEYMTVDEYDELILDPSDFWTRKYLPRVFGTLDPLGSFGPVTDIQENVHLVDFAPLANPAMIATLEKLIEVGKEYQRLNAILGPHRGDGAAHGFPVAASAFAKAPFDVIGDTLRGTTGIMKDMFRCPGKLLKALDVVADLTIARIKNLPQFGSLLMVGYPLHKGADGWMSQKQFDTFYWPSMKKVMDALIEEGLLQRLFAEGGYESRLDKVDQFGKGDVLWYFDKTDMALAKKHLGKNCCVMGNVPSSLLMTGTAAEVKEHCRKLIETCKAGGGYILAPGAVGTSINVDNLKAIVEAAREYGVYRK